MHVGGLKVRGQHHHKLRFPQIGETRAVLGDSGECRMWELVTNLVSLSFLVGLTAHIVRDYFFSFISLLALSTMGTPLEDEYPTSFRDFFILCVSFQRRP